MSKSAVVPEQMSSATVWTLCQSHCPSLEGNEFHRRDGPAVVKHRSLKVLCDRRTAHIAVSVERSRRMLISAMSWQSSARYVGALRDRHWKTKTATLNWTRCRTGNQCICRKIGVMWSRRRAPVASRPAAFWTDCARRRRSTLQTCHTVLAVAKRPCDCCIGQFWPNVNGRRYFADIVGLPSTTVT